MFHVWYVVNLFFFSFQTLSFYFPECGTIPPPVIQVQNVSFRYADDKVIFCFSIYVFLNLLFLLPTKWLTEFSFFFSR